MKTLVASVFALAMMAAPAFASTISDVDHPDVPNCTIFGTNAANCENLTMQAVHAPNGLGGKFCFKNQYNVKVCVRSW